MDSKDAWHPHELMPLFTPASHISLISTFSICCSEQKGDPEDFRLQEEMKAYGDILRLDVVDSYDDLSKKTLKMFTVLPQKIDAYFYFKVDDDVALNIDAMETYLTERKNQGNLYLVSTLLFLSKWPHYDVKLLLCGRCGAHLLLCSLQQFLAKGHKICLKACQTIPLFRSHLRNMVALMQLSWECFNDHLHAGLHEVGSSPDR